MRTVMTRAAAVAGEAAGTAAAIGIGAPLLGALCLPVVFPVVVAAVAVTAWRLDGAAAPRR
jgi:hypothetical protein